jgi:hypothetical protein
MAETASRTSLENALRLYAPPNRQNAASCFLEALSVDELLFLADFLGSCILITSAINMDTWDAICHNARAWHRQMDRMSPAQRQDVSHKLMLVTEFAERCGFVIKYR